MGNPYTAPTAEATHPYVLPYALNVLEDQNMDQMSALLRHCTDMMAVNLTAMNGICDEALNYISNVSGNMFIYD
mgnify:CR=1 FL=1